MKKSISIIAAIALFSSGCGPTRSSTEPRLYEEMRVSDVVKLISTDIKSAADERTYDQQRYKIGPESRLLIMYSTLGDQVGRINTADGGKVLLEISSENAADAERAASSVKLCPVTAKWMLLATWERAFPRKKWSSPGGDFDLDGCITPTLFKPQVTLTTKDSRGWVKPTPTPTPSSRGWVTVTPSNSNPAPTPTPSPTPTPTPQPAAADGTLYFDVTRWYLDYPKGRNVNLGLILISEQELHVMGDRSGSRSPRLYWYEREDAIRNYYDYRR